MPGAADPLPPSAGTAMRLRRTMLQGALPAALIASGAPRETVAGKAAAAA